MNMDKGCKREAMYPIWLAFDYWASQVLKVIVSDPLVPNLTFLFVIFSALTFVKVGSTCGQTKSGIDRTCWRLAGQLCRAIAFWLEPRAS